METYLPIALGYWTDEGLDVTIQGFDGSGPAIQALDAGQITAASGVGTSTVAAADIAGSSLSCFAVGLTHSYIFVARMPSTDGLNSFSDLGGKRLGVLSLESSQYSWANAALRDAGVDPSTVTFIAVGQGAEAAQALRSGQIDALVESAANVQQNIPEAVRVESPFLDDLGFYTCMVAPKSTIESQRDVVVGLGRGYLKALVFAKTNPKAAVEAFWQAYPAARPTGDPDKALADTVKSLEVRLESMLPTDGKYGYVSDNVVKTQLDALVAGGALKSNVDTSSIWTDELVADMNDFDVAAVEQEAKEWKAS